MAKIRGVVGGLLIAVAALLATGCAEHETIHDPPKVIGERKNGNGQVVQQIILDETIYVTIQPLTPEGPHRSGTRDRHYYLDEPGKPRREIPGLQSVPIFLNSALPVADTNLWVAVSAEYESGGSAPAISRPKQGGGIELIAYADVFRTLVFNADGAVAEQKDYSFWINKKEEEFRYDTGNRAIIFRSPQGFKKYDVVKNTVSDLPTNRDSLYTDPLP
ncbi:MAG TPA: hypothetical protein VGJ04_10250 [Pirellulales bacterium]|jgi:hypothetical protein